ncbi:hypothetical protein OY671_010619, partial [Metschnikowia pulcherrima]
RMNETSPIRVSLVDDEAASREPSADYLVRQGFAVTQAGTAAEARSRSVEAAFDIVSLDIMMPGEDGSSSCRHSVEARQIPVIFITAKGEATDRIVGSEIGADDYVVKPFDPRESVARVRSVSRRAVRQAAEPADAVVYEFEGWQLDPLKRRSTDPEGASVAISSAEFRSSMAF